VKMLGSPHFWLERPDRGPLGKITRPSTPWEFSAATGDVPDQALARRTIRPELTGETSGLKSWFYVVAWGGHPCPPFPPGKRLSNRAGAGDYRSAGIVRNSRGFLDGTLPLLGREDFNRNRRLHTNFIQ
jgi:hypothetical protein